MTLTDFQIDLPGGRSLRYPDLTLNPGETVLLQGPSGRGKSLLLQALAGILQRPLRSRGTLSGLKELVPLWVPPEPSRILPPGLRLGQHLKSLNLDPARVARILSQFGQVRPLPKDWPARYPDQVSGGELQRLALAFLFSRQGNLWLIDEPSIGLDAPLRKVLPELLSELIAEQPDSILLAASHDPKLLGSLPSVRVVLLEPLPPQTVTLRLEPPPEEKPWLGVQDLEVQVPKTKKWLLGGLDLVLHPGRVHWLRGPSGSGKTLLARSILRLTWRDRGTLAWLSLKGTVRLDRIQPQAGQRDRQAMRSLRPELGWVPQDSRWSFFPGRRVGRQMGFEIDTGLLEELGLEAGLLNSFPETLSSGELKRVDLYRVLAGRPRLLILDEPLAAVDVPTRRLVLAAVRRWAVEVPCAVLLYSHESAEENMADSWQGICGI